MSTPRQAQSSTGQEPRPPGAATSALLAALLAAVGLPAFAQDPDHDVAPDPSTPVAADAAEEKEPGKELEVAGVEGVRRETREAVEALRAYAESERTEAIAYARTTLAPLDREAAAMQARIEERWATMDADARERARRMMQDVAARRAESARRLEAMDQATGAAWSDVREGFVRSYAELSRALLDARGEFGGKPAGPTEDTDGAAQLDESDETEPRDAPL